MDNTADLILLNGEIDSVGMDGKLTISSAVAVKGARIVYVGADDGVLSMKGPDTEFVDLTGKTVLPGLADSHLHASATAELLFSLNMYEVACAPKDTRETLIGKYLDLVRKGAENHPGDGWIRGTGWNPAVFLSFDNKQPTRQDLDMACADRPVALRSFDHHYLWVNTRELELSGITKDTPTPRNGEIRRDSEGNPTGLFVETPAIDLFLGRAEGADYSVEEYKAGLRAYQKDFANPYGTVLIFDAMATKNAMSAYREMAQAGEFTLRVKGSMCADPSLPMSQFDEMIRNCITARWPGSYEIDTVKFFVDGSEFTFLMREPFAAEALKRAGLPPDYAGYPQWRLSELREAFLIIVRAGLQIHLHCMGDGAVTLALDAFEHVAQRADLARTRPVIAHIMNIREADIARMARLGIIAAMQPMWGVVDSFSETAMTGLLGRERVAAQFPTGSLRKGGVRVSAGTDFPVTIPPNPYIGMQCGITRSLPRSHPEYTVFGKRRLGPSSEPLRNAVSLKDMVESYTISEAYQSFLEDVTGSIAEGKSADFVVLDRKLTAMPSMEIENVKVLRTYLKGKPVFRAD